MELEDQEWVIKMDGWTAAALMGAITQFYNEHKDDEDNGGRLNLELLKEIEPVRVK